MLDLEYYFDRGYVISQVPVNLLPDFWMEVYTTEWVDDPEGVYKGKPSWYSSIKKYNITEDGDLQNLVERTYGTELLKLAPESLKDVATRLIHDSYFDPLRAFKESATLTYAHFWNGAEEIPWHYDTIDSSDTLVFIYLTEESQWLDEWGGKISFCKEVCDEQLHVTTVMPQNATMIVVNNANPLFKHKVQALLNNNVNRYTLSLCYKWN